MPPGRVVAHGTAACHEAARWHGMAWRAAAPPAGSRVPGAAPEEQTAAGSAPGPASRLRASLCARMEPRARLGRGERPSASAARRHPATCRCGPALPADASRPASGSSAAEREWRSDTRAGGTHGGGLTSVGLRPGSSLGSNRRSTVGRSGVHHLAQNQGENAAFSF